MLAWQEILKKEPVGREVNSEDVFTVNEDFKSKFTKIKVKTVTAIKESVEAAVKTRTKVEEDRKPLVEAAVVRIMKSRKQLEHNALVAEVTQQLTHRELPPPAPPTARFPCLRPGGLPLTCSALGVASGFIPSPQFIKKRIESLIERDYLERGADQKVYKYLA